VDLHAYCVNLDIRHAMPPALRGYAHTTFRVLRYPFFVTSWVFRRERYQQQPDCCGFEERQAQKRLSNS